ncbi:uncharacterized protein LOC126773929 [Nymphalis io]|uniref:uncharacterized protein LOC126773929 n=1 Tax=Inachis io TaxID=171585 RepID=UPI00216A5B64|nr:uncharacterized protein LOC126773929 [Nymphalis io]
MCNCSKLTYCMGNMVYIFERLASCCALTSVITCLILTLLIMLALGIGLGYNYCYIHMHTEDMEDGNYVLEKPVYSHVTTSADGLIVVQSSVTTPPTSSVTTPPMSSVTPPPISSVTPSTIDTDSGWIVPLNTGIDFTNLIQKIRERKQNVTIHLVV